MIVSPKAFVTDVKKIYKPAQASNVACGRVSNSCHNPYEREHCNFTEIWKLKRRNGYWNHLKGFEVHLDHKLSERTM